MCRCLATSAGPAIVCILGNKYGYRPFPAEIEQAEFERLLSAVQNLDSSSDGNQLPVSNDTTLLRQYFRLDLNSVPPKYVLRASTGDANWSHDFGVIQAQLRAAADKTLPEQESEKYRISVTEAEIHAGVFKNEARSEQVSNNSKFPTAWLHYIWSAGSKDMSGFNF
jgi:hypothetical protein